MSHRISGFQCSPIRRLSPYAVAAAKKGIKVHYLNIGQPDIKTPEEALNAVRNYSKPNIPYGPSEGLYELRESVVEYYKNHDVDLDVEDVLITTGGSEALQFSFMTLCDPFDEIIIPEPYYTNVTSFARTAMVDLVPITSRIEDSFSLPPIEEFEKRITRKTGAILLCSPNNPTGYIYTKEEMKSILELCKKYDIFLIVDEVYREFCYEDEFSSVLTYKGYEDRVVCIDSFSKRFSMCGSRIGAVVTKNEEFKANILKLSQARLCPPDIEQVAAIAALKTSPSYLADVKEEYKKRRDFLSNGLKKIDGIISSTPKGAFYLVAELPVDDAEKFAIFMLNEFSYENETVMIAPAEDFYVTPKIGKKQARIAYVLNTSDLERALICLEKGLKAYQEKYL
ncbi:MAG: pyridoxal phosphate-dependent aminotransferase [Sphaerochaetaceae bacterium]|nr:pyridoxal phosphate-dependent aminotransferase [Sphaerochaetaceae bacterium]MDC7249117.1 pyridoxal phosphate-dependent aminotransferase [Sphaerochaetaceae bacterium]